MVCRFGLAVDLIEKTLEFNPAKRISVNDALKHPYLAKFRQPEQETECKTAFDFEFEKVPMTKQRLRGTLPNSASSFACWLVCKRLCAHVLMC